MLINFNEIPEKAIEHFKGGEKTFRVKMFTDENNKIMRGVLEAGASIGLHTHEGNSEIVYVLGGTGKMLYKAEPFRDAVSEPLSEGSCTYCPMGHSHSLINDSDGELEFYAVVPEHK